MNQQEADRSLAQAVMGADAEGVQEALRQGGNPAAINPLKDPSAVPEIERAKDAPEHGSKPGALWSMSIARDAYSRPATLRALANAGVLEDFWVAAARGGANGRLGRQSALHLAVSVAAFTSDAVERDLLNAAKRIVAEGLCDIDETNAAFRDKTTLMWAAFAQRANVWNWAAGLADWSVENERHETALSEALRAAAEGNGKRDLDLLRAVECAKRSARPLGLTAKRFAMSWALALPKAEDEEVIRAMFELIPLAEYETRGGEALRAAATNNQELAVRILAPMSDARAVDASGKTALSASLRHGDAALGAVKALWSGSDIDHVEPERPTQTRLGPRVVPEAGVFGFAFARARMADHSWGLADWVGSEWLRAPRAGDNEETVAARVAVVLKMTQGLLGRMPKLQAALDAHELAEVVKSGGFSREETDAGMDGIGGKPEELLEEPRATPKRL